MLEQQIPIIIAEGEIVKKELELQGALQYMDEHKYGCSLSAKQMDLVLEYLEVVKTLNKFKKELKNGK